MTINREDVIRVTKELLAENGEDYVYLGSTTGDCQYAPQDVPITTYDAKYDEEVETGEYEHVPGCLVGQIVERLNPEAYESLKVWESAIRAQAEHSDFNPIHLADNEALFGLDLSRLDAEKREHYLSRTAIIDVGDDAALTVALKQAQAYQDSGKPWGEATKGILALEV
jgi:hypothetical protein